MDPVIGRSPVSGHWGATELSLNPLSPLTFAVNGKFFFQSMREELVHRPVNFFSFLI